MRLLGGYTNESFAHDDGRVVRRSWSGKPAEQLAAEERVLDALVGRVAFDTPRILARHHDAGRTVDVFSRCRGEPGPRYLAPGDVTRARVAMRRLRELHATLAALPCSEAHAWGWLARRLATVVPGPHLPANADRVLARITSLIPTTPATTQWLHGDYHLGNLLWTGDDVTAVVDFDDTGCGSAVSEAVMAAFALARQPVEARFTYDRELWFAAITAYEPALAVEPDTFVELFCGYQVLIHLLAAQRGLWPLEPGIGFWPCWALLGE